MPHGLHHEEELRAEAGPDSGGQENHPQEGRTIACDGQRLDEGIEEVHPSAFDPPRKNPPQTLVRLTHRAAEKVERDHEGRQNQERSEEHTSELQSQSNLVCRLLLEKKKKKNKIKN